MNSNHISGAEIVIRCLHEEKVKFVFGYPGGAVLNIYDAVFQQNNPTTQAFDELVHNFETQLKAIVATRKNEA
mgnify:CR=1 FL=1